MSEFRTWNVFVQDRFLISEKRTVKGLAFYIKGDTDRPNLTLLGEYIGEFPIQYPMRLANGITVNESDYYRDEKDYSEE